MKEIFIKAGAKIGEIAANPKTWKILGTSLTIVGAVVGVGADRVNQRELRITAKEEITELFNEHIKSLES